MTEILTELLKLTAHVRDKTGWENADDQIDGKPSKFGGLKK